MAETKCVALVHEEFGKPEEVLRLQEVDLAPLQQGEVLIRMEAAAIHPSDLGMVGGSYGHLRELPAVGGREGVGTVVEVGSGVPGSWEGKRVRLPEGPGVWRSMQIARAEQLSEVPAEVPADQAALSAVNPTTAIRLLSDFADLQEGDWVVQNAGNSAVGVAVIQLAKARGIKTASLVRREELMKPLQEQGADLVVIDDRSAAEAIREARGDARMPLGLNSIGGSSVLNLAQSVSDVGTIVTFGGMTGEKIRFPTRHLIFNDIRFCGFWMDKWNQKNGARAQQDLLNEVYREILNGSLKTPVEKVYPLASYKEALEHNGSGRFGKVLFGNV
ncbi:MDR family NADPH-dependent oxidoreductase [Puniceicoccus vermicola]|uniref:enoyl-[acyl-carrier-protein] reductase n=1 Tax=Puniceicoccus vermicola TaxID=388746 RepID=A0A7X1AZH1_9BACT|nr:2-enoyl thioester reductase domain-containing protein [Puniceicoccus vermicola]MBC2601725.1 zinc-binding dehydrogenase [Puniceicoccus vermicola]